MNQNLPWSLGGQICILDQYFYSVFRICTNFGSETAVFGICLFSYCQDSKSSLICHVSGIYLGVFPDGNIDMLFLHSLGTPSIGFRQDGNLWPIIIFDPWFLDVRICISLHYFYTLANTHKI